MPNEARLRARRHAAIQKEGAVRRTIRKLRAKAHHLHAKHRALTKKIRALPSGRLRAVKWAVDQVGTTESPYGSNRGPKVSEWNKRAIGIDGVPWCQSFADAVLVAGGGPQLKSAYTVQVIQWAREGKYGLKIVSIAQRQPGDFVYFKWPGVSNDVADHVGVDVGNGATVEGNTSSGSSGSQNNGGQVALRTRGNGYVVAVVRPTYG
jgi:hypothetical protein